MRLDFESGPSLSALGRFADALAPEGTKAPSSIFFIKFIR
jgi:hypothetical protein